MSFKPLILCGLPRRAILQPMRPWIKLVVCLPVAVGLIALPWIAAHVEARHGEEYFRKLYTGGPPEFFPVLSDYEWAVIFGGHAGLRRLKALSEDQSLKPMARWTAGQAFAYIGTGRFQKEMATTEEVVPFFQSPLFRMELFGLRFREALLSLTE
ncbi:MAG: hypothetical protein ABJF10_04020 [Chthoniobacter sp.]|uniref:hypothetical protein n=1 Tax=Chthoniobacter sp. TaxID=2510640 RepID=UPI0032ADEFE6